MTSMPFDQSKLEKLREARRQKHGQSQPETEFRQSVIIAPFRWPDPASIPPRKFLFGQHYARKAVGATVGGGGRAKTTLALCEAISMAAGLNLLTDSTIEPLRVSILNGEEDQAELERRIAAICQHYSIQQADCGGRLFVQSVRDKPLRLATTSARNVPSLNHKLLEQLEAEIKSKGIDVFMLDPLISFHSIAENANSD